MSINNPDPESERLLWRSQSSLRKQAARIPRRAYLAALFAFSAIVLLVLTLALRPPAHFPGDGADLPDLVLPQLLYNETTHPAPPTAFEIVISHHSEPLPALADTLHRLLHHPTLRTTPPRITVYTKHPTVQLDTLSTALSLPSSSIHRLPNLGREGGTYLHHLLTRFDTLAAHTLFVQAAAHNERAMLHRLQDYLLPSTGFLNLGFSGHGCAIGDCADRYGWRDVHGHIPAVWGWMFRSVPPERRMALTYKGQFVVSRRRVWGADPEARKELLRGLREVLEGEGEFARSLQGERGAPRFGYVLERMWGLVFGCADGRLVESCPSLWGRREDGPVEACQCLDEIA